MPPRANAESVRAMENVPGVYTRPYDERRPVACRDEAPRRLLADVREPLPVAPGAPARVEYEYERRGTADPFMAFGPLAGKRRLEATGQRTKADFARFRRRWGDEWHPAAGRITPVVDNLNRHEPSVLYEVFEPAEARRIIGRLEFVYTPQHASRLNRAELELSAPARRCPGPRPPEGGTLAREVAAREAGRNAAVATVIGQFTAADARVKLKRLYPSIELQ